MAARGEIAALDNTGATGQLLQDRGQQLFVPLDAQRTHLHHQIITITIDDQTGQIVTLAMNQPVDRGFATGGQGGPASECGLDAALPKGLINPFFLFPGEDAHLDLAGAVEIALRQPTTIGIVDIDQVTVRGSAR